MTKCNTPAKSNGKTPWLNWIEQPPPKGQVAGSNPAGVTIQKPNKSDSYLFFTSLVVKAFFNKWVACCQPFNNESTNL